MTRSSRAGAHGRVEVEHGGLRLELDVGLGRPAPMCSNPSSPCFADPGDPAEVELVSVRCAACGAKVSEQGWPRGEELAHVEVLALAEAEARLEAGAFGETGNRSPVEL